MINGIEILRLLEVGPTTIITTAMQNLSNQIQPQNDAMIRIHLCRFIFHAQHEINSQNTQGAYYIK